jgi:3',5'-cyclic AMP phosphodiesterase CpdA
MIRLAHLSDIHLTTPELPWQWGDWFTKRYPGWLNFRYLGRKYRFRHADEVLGVLIDEVHQRAPDHIVFSGDATALGFAPEFEKAAELLRVGDPNGARGLAVPGNHDYYTRTVAASGLFEKYFAPWMEGVRVDGATYPFAQRVGPVWLVGVNSCTGNRWPWDAGGSVGPEQRERLRRLLEQLEPGPRILVTHYPVALASGRHDRRTHGLRDVHELVEIAARGGVCLWLHGHRHGSYSLADRVVPFPVICAGSATQTGLWSYGEYTMEDNQCQVACRIYDPHTRHFRERETFALRLPNAGEW